MSWRPMRVIRPPPTLAEWCPICETDLREWNHRELKYGPCPILQEQVTRDHAEALEKHCPACGETWPHKPMCPRGRLERLRVLSDRALADLVQEPAWLLFLREVKRKGLACAWDLALALDNIRANRLLTWGAAEGYLRRAGSPHVEPWLCSWWAGERLRPAAAVVEDPWTVWAAAEASAVAPLGSRDVEPTEVSVDVLEPTPTE